MKPHGSPTPLATTGARTPVAMEKYTGQLYRFLVRRLRTRQDAEDLLQTIFLRFWQHPEHELVRKPEAYLYQIASNVLAEYRLRQSKSLVVFDSETTDEHADRLSESDAWGDTIADAHGQTQQLQRVLKQIPPMYRAALVLRTCDGLSFEEIGTRLGLSKKSAKTYVSRAIACCRLADWKR